MGTTKSLFIISPIGPRNSEIRVHFDKVRRHIINPVARDKGYKTLRSDDIAKPGRITSQIIDHLINDDLVVADLSRKNPNVYYELAIRHSVKNPVILIGESDLDIPFDLAAQRVIPYSLDPDDINDAKIQLGLQIDAVELKSFIVDSPITDVIDIKSKDISEEEENVLQKILTMLESQYRQFGDLKTTSQSDKRGFIREAKISTYLDWLPAQYINIINVFRDTHYGHLTILDVSRRTGLDRRTVSETVSELERMGVIKRNTAYIPHTFHLI